MAYNEIVDLATNQTTGILPVAKGGTNASSLATTNGLIKFDGTRLVTSSAATLDASNRYKNTAQPMVFAYINSASVADQTGDGTLVTVVFDATTVNQGTNYSTSTGIFTAPIAGNYLVTTSMTYQQLGALFTLANLSIVASTNSITMTNTINPGIQANSGNNCSQTNSAIVALAASGTVRIQVLISGSTKTIDFAGNSSGVFSYLSITLLG